MGPIHDWFGPMKTVHQTVLIGLTNRVYAALEILGKGAARLNSERFGNGVFPSISKRL